MTKKEMKKLFAKEAGITQKEAKRLLDLLGDIVFSKIAEGEDVPLPGIGKIVATEISARVCYNPTTKKYNELPSTYKVSLRAAAILKEAAKKIK